MDSRIVETKLNIIFGKRVVGVQEIGPVEVRVADYVSPGTYSGHAAWTVLAAGDTWPAGKTVFVRFPVEVPALQEHVRAVLHVDSVGIEGLLSLDGVPYAGIDQNHRDVALQPSTTYAVEIEGAVWLRALHDPAFRHEVGRLPSLEVRFIDTRIERAWYDLSFAYDGSSAISDRRRREPVLRAIEDAMLAIDVTREGEAFVSEVEQGREILNREIGEIGRDSQELKVALTAHAHIDVAWLWPLSESVRKCSRTFSTVTRLLERYSGFFFSCSQPLLYQYTKDHFPDLYGQIKKWVAEGRWETTGGMWVETDCNVTSGESLIRQSLHGLRFFREEFGTRPRICWLPDVFGFSGALPQILSACGYTGFYTVKLHWQARNRFPHTVFWWRGIDGSRVLAHIPRLSHMYNAQMEPAELRAAVDEVDQFPPCESVLMPFGFGDGGGGPTEKMLEYADRSAGFPGLPVTRHTGADAFFEEILASDPELPEWVGELYLETHRGTLTSQARTKKGNRKNELALRDAEILGWMASMTGRSIDMKSLDSAWKNLLTLQFHDILPGSSIRTVHQEAEEDHRKISSIAHAVSAEAGQAIASRVNADLVVLNTLSWDRNDLVVGRLPLSVVRGELLELIDPEGRVFPAQCIGTDGQYGEYLFKPPAVPSLGYTALRVAAASAGAASAGAASAAATGEELQVGNRSLENEFCLIEINDRGELVRYYDKDAGREVIDPNEPANRLQFFQDGPERESAWNVHATFEGREYPSDGECRIATKEQGPVRISLVVEHRFRDSLIVQEIRLCRGERRVDFHTRVDWHERQVLLKAAFPVRILSDSATCEVQFGALRRSTHRNTSWEQEKFEVAAHRWVDLSEAGYGVSLLNDCKYGHDIRDNVMRISLLRGPENPDPTADLGEHEFTYSLYPHPADWCTAETVRRAAELNTPAIAVPGNVSETANAPLADEHSFATVDGPAILDTIKPADDGDGWIFRSYEPNGARGTTRIHLGPLVDRVCRVNAVEEHLGEIAPVDGEVAFESEPFRIDSIRCRFASPASVTAE